jgi:hypothetical protein
VVTVVRKSIGSNGRDYATIAAWFAAIPGNIVTLDQEWIGELYNDSLFAGNAQTNFVTQRIASFSPPRRVSLFKTTRISVTLP